MHKVVLWVQQILVPALGPAGLFMAAFLDSSFLSLPEINDLLVVTWAAARPETAWVPVLMATLGSIAGCSVLWWLGGRGGEAFLVRRFGAAQVERTRAAFERWDLLALAVPAVLPPPMPFKVFVLSAGVFRVSYRRFVLTLLVARGLRYVVWGALGVVYGDEAMGLLRAVDAWFAERVAAAGVVTAVLLLLVGAGYCVRRCGRAPSASQEAR
ncbi:MAG: DedA family protein [Acidobacteria bacterium]|nr:DedA family protein [Acidobacteriota bacterium]